MSRVALFFECGDPDVRVDAIETAAHSVSTGELVVLPTDTVYGLGADAFDADAVRDLLNAKGRGRDFPVPVLVGSWWTIDGLVTAVDVRTRARLPAGTCATIESCATATSSAWAPNRPSA